MCYRCCCCIENNDCLSYHNIFVFFPFFLYDSSKCICIYALRIAVCADFLSPSCGSCGGIRDELNSHIVRLYRATNKNRVLFDVLDIDDYERARAKIRNEEKTHIQFDAWLHCMLDAIGLVVTLPINRICLSNARYPYTKSFRSHKLYKHVHQQQQQHVWYTFMHFLSVTYVSVRQYIRIRMQTGLGRTLISVPNRCENIIDNEALMEGSKWQQQPASSFRKRHNNHSFAWHRPTNRQIVRKCVYLCGNQKRKFVFKPKTICFISVTAADVNFSSYNESQWSSHLVILQIAQKIRLCEGLVH